MPGIRARKLTPDIPLAEYRAEPERLKAAANGLGAQSRLGLRVSGLFPASGGALRGETSVLAQEIALEVARVLRDASVSGNADPKRLGDVQPALLNMEQAAKYLGRTVKGIRELITKGILVPVRLDRKIQFKRRDLDDVIDRYTE